MRFDGFVPHRSLIPLGLDILRQLIIVSTRLLYRENDFHHCVFFIMFITAVVIVYVVVKVIDFLVVAKRA